MLCILWEVWSPELVQNDCFLLSYQIPTGWDSSHQLCLSRRRLKLEVPPLRQLSRLPPYQSRWRHCWKVSHFTFPSRLHYNVSLLEASVSLHWLDREPGQLIWTGHLSFRPLEVRRDEPQEIACCPEVCRQYEVCIRKNFCKWNLHFSEIFCP